MILKQTHLGQLGAGLWFAACVLHPKAPEQGRGAWTRALSSSHAHACSALGLRSCSQQPDTWHSWWHGDLRLPKPPPALAVTAQQPARAAIPQPGPWSHAGHHRGGPQLFRFIILGPGNVRKFESDVTNLASPRLGSPARLKTTALSQLPACVPGHFVPWDMDPALPGMLPASPCPGGCCQGQQGMGWWGCLAPGITEGFWGSPPPADFAASPEGLLGWMVVPERRAVRRLVPALLSFELTAGILAICAVSHQRVAFGGWELKSGQGVDSTPGMGSPAPLGVMSPKVLGPAQSWQSVPIRWLVGSPRGRGRVLWCMECPMYPGTLTRRRSPVWRTPHVCRIPWVYGTHGACSLPCVPGPSCKVPCAHRVPYACGIPDVLGVPLSRGPPWRWRRLRRGCSRLEPERQRRFPAAKPRLTHLQAHSVAFQSRW